jgi:hypothetical protein
MRRPLAALILSATVLAFAGSVAAQPMSPLSVKAFRRHALGVDQVFGFEIANALDRELGASGRLVVLNVYDTEPPVTLPIGRFLVPPGGTAVIRVAWTGAPLAGSVRALLVLNDGEHPSLVESFGFWIVPYAAIGVSLGIILLAVLFALAAARLPRWLRKRVPANMAAYRVEDDDSVMTLSTKFDVSWQDIVKANRLKPPYALRPGMRILIPKHALRHPDPFPRA